MFFTSRRVRVCTIALLCIATVSITFAVFVGAAAVPVGVAAMWGFAGIGAAVAGADAGEKGMFKGIFTKGRSDE